MTNASNQSLLVIGECMMELSGDGDVYRRAFAGDTYNSAVYAKRCRNDLDVQILTAVGSDSVSAAMLAQWDRDQVGHALVMTSAQAHPGIYAIATDATGERSFTYWRAASAATELVSLMNEATRKGMAQFDYLYFSGITLAILSDADKAALLALLADLKKLGRTIAFDPNYRAALWRDKNHATHWLTQAYQLTDIALPGLADHQELYGHQNSDAVRAFLQDLHIGEIVLKADAAGVFGYLRDKDPVHVSITPERNPKDTTGAGDSFAGTYLAERMAGTSMTNALGQAAKVASLVVQHPGAIIDPALYRKLIHRNS